MSKPLSPQELSVLQENLDLFSSPLQHLNNAQQETKKSMPSINVTRKTASSKRPLTQAQSKAKGRPRQRASKIDANTPHLNQQLPLERDDPKRKQTIRHSKSCAPAMPPQKPSRLGPFGVGKQILWVRSASLSQAKEVIEEKGITIDNYALEKRDPALRNLSATLFAKELSIHAKGEQLYSFLINSEQTSQALHQKEGIEVVFTCEWFELRKSAIRGLKGGDYIDACANLAEELRPQYRN